MKVGDLVKSKDTRVTVLACGSGRYETAMVYNLVPFKLISEEGDMIWECMNQEHFEVVGEADRKTLARALVRFMHELIVKYKEI